jgi:hypothetical protein
MQEQNTKHGPKDPLHIHVHEPNDLKYWSEHFGLTEHELIEIVQKVGQSVEAFRRYHHEHPKTVTLIVEGKPHPWSKPEITYAQLVTLEVPTYPEHPEITYSVKYKHGPHENPHGVLAPGASVRVKNRMTFSVSETGKS